MKVRLNQLGRGKCKIPHGVILRRSRGIMWFVVKSIYLYNSPNHRCKTQWFHKLQCRCWAQQYSTGTNDQSEVCILFHFSPCCESSCKFVGSLADETEIFFTSLEIKFTNLIRAVLWSNAALGRNRWNCNLYVHNASSNCLITFTKLHEQKCITNDLQWIKQLHILRHKNVSPYQFFMVQEIKAHV